MTITEAPEIDIYIQAAQQLRSMANKTRGTVAVMARVPAGVAELIDKAAIEFEQTRSDVVRSAIELWLREMSAQNLSDDHLINERLRTADASLADWVAGMVE